MSLQPIAPMAQVYDSLTIEHVEDPELRALAFIIQAMKSHEIGNSGRERLADYIAARFSLNGGAK